MPAYLTSERIRELRQRANLRQEDLAVLFGVGIASINRWERPGSTLPSGIARQLYEAMDTLERQGVELSQLQQRLHGNGNMAALQWLLNSLSQAKGEQV